MHIETWFAFFTASFILTMMPGPSILLGMVHSMRYGISKTFFTALGDISANFIQMVIVAVGLGVLISTSEQAFTLIKWFGITTLLYMGIKMIFFSRSKQPQLQKLTDEAIPTYKLYWSGFLVAAGNPKAIVFFTAFFPQFIDPTQPLLSQMAIMCPTMATLDFSWVMLYALLANKSLHFMKAHPQYMNRIGGTALLGAACVLWATQ